MRKDNRSPALRRFTASISQAHGDPSLELGYDLDALRQLSGHELVTALCITGEADFGMTWREIEVFETIGNDQAVAHLEYLSKHGFPYTQYLASEALQRLNAKRHRKS